MIKNLIFDFGDVLINLDKKAVPAALKALGRDEQDSDLIELSNRYEKGLITTDAFLSVASESLGLEDRETLKALWNRTICDFPQRRLAFLEDLKEKGTHRMFLLSNTNELHMEYVQQKMGENHFQRFRNCFDGFYLSYQINMRKPEPEIFRHVLGRHGMSADETLFIDDTIEHILSAASLGLHTWHLRPGKDEVVDLAKQI